MDQIKGVPEGYRLGQVVGTQGGGLGDGFYAVVELVPVEQPTQFDEAVIAVRIHDSGWIGLENALKHGEPWHRTMAESFAKEFPASVTIREKEPK